MKKFHPEMKVVRFGAEDMIVTSGAADMVFHSTMGDNTPANGEVTFDGSSYPINNYGDVYKLLVEIGTKYNTDVNDTKIDCNDATVGLFGLLTDEVDNGIGARWNGFYTYDSTSNKFTKQ